MKFGFAPTAARTLRFGHGRRGWGRGPAAIHVHSRSFTVPCISKRSLLHLVPELSCDLQTALIVARGFLWCIVSLLWVAVGQRDAVQRLLVQRGDAGAAAGLRGLLSPDHRPQVRVQALATLGLLKGALDAAQQ